MVTASGMIERHVEPDHSVLIVGGFLGPKTDPTALTASLITARGKGHVHIVDYQSERVLQKLLATGTPVMANQKRQVLFDSLLSDHQVPTASKPISADSQWGGSGDAMKHREEIGQLATVIPSLRKPAVHIYDLRKPTGFKDKRFDTIVDNGSFYWIVRSAPEDMREAAMARLACEYKRIGRKLVLFYHAQPNNEVRWQAGYAGRMQDALEAAGAKVTQREVTPEFHLKLGKAGHEELEKLYGWKFQKLRGKTVIPPQYPYDRALVAEFTE